MLTRLISDFGQQKDSLRETWHNLDHSIQQRGTVLELGSRRLTLGWGLRQERHMFIKRKKFMSVILRDRHMHITIILSLNVSKYYIPERGSQVIDELSSHTLAGHSARYSLTISNKKSGFSFSKYSTPRGRPCRLEKCVSTASFSRLVTSSCSRRFFTARMARRYSSSWKNFNWKGKRQRRGRREKNSTMAFCKMV